MLSGDALEKMERYLGLVAAVTAEEFETRYRSGKFGSALTNVIAPGGEEVANDNGSGEITQTQSSFSVGQEIEDALADSVEPTPMWKPGISFFGEVDMADSAVKMAKGEGVDIVFHFDIYLKAVRGSGQNTSRCRLMHVASGKSLGVTKGIDSAEAVKFARSGKYDHREYVQNQMASLWLITDRSLMTSAMPALTAPSAKQRVAVLLSTAKRNSLAALAEIRYYQLQGLLTEAEVEQAFDVVGGDDAMMILYGPPEEKLAIVRQWAVDAVPEAAQ